MFEKRAFGGELEVQELMEYFHECDLYPTAMELDEGFDSVFRGICKFPLETLTSN